jgi:threonine/homoserine/homoserine lactone efflux protein
MKLSWLFGSSMEAHHLLVYLSVWLIQGGYCAWIAWQWLRETRTSGIQASNRSSEDNL